MKIKFPFYQQPDAMDCGPTCLRMVAKYHGRTISLEKLRKISETTRAGSSLQGVSFAAESIGFKTLGVKIDFINLVENAPLPCIVFWNERHFVVVYKIKKNKIYVADPGHGLLVYEKQEFIHNWIGKHANEKTEEGIALLLEPTPRLIESEDDDQTVKKGFKFLFQYLKGYRRLMIQLGLGLLVVSLLQLIFPFLTQSVVDIGIQNRDVNFLYLVLVGQLFVFLGRTSVEIIRGWILLHLSTRINISLVSDFLIKLMKLPLAFFDIKMTGDIMQRIGDHQRIEHLLTNQSLNVLFSIINFIVFGIVLAIYNIPVFLIFLAGTIIYFSWVSFFMKKRKDLDHKRFTQMSDERMKIMELISGMQEIKLHNAERQKRWGWEMVQVRLFKLQISSLRLEQLQSQGAAFINELKNILISFFTAKLVIDGQLTLGMMLSVSYIIGQLNGPISQFLGFVFSLQDARISLERLAEIHNKEDEEPAGVDRLSELPDNCEVELENLTFRYVGSDTEVLKNVNLLIPKNKITAIVGASGSGKTTLMKLLLRFYEPINGKIKVGNIDLNSFTQFVWRENCGSVMQDGFLFSDTIANNIAVGEDRIDKEKLKKAVHIANIQEFIESLPLSYNTKIGAEGMGISGGQKQRILIARAVYKNPQFLFFDEATSALDAQNETIIMQNLNDFFQGRTAVVIAHRLSTVKNADQIIVIDNGTIIEKGTHRDLLNLRGSYYNLVKNQLELEKIEKTNEH
ncbi:MAG: peptidase domain-containing ABC transporter [Crocinitomicaceae bacterium]|nr:peptidase domain-containing ABC transporter [Crocinitomicaceae bacterium]